MESDIAVARIDDKTVGVANNHFTIDIDRTTPGAECLR